MRSSEFYFTYCGKLRAAHVGLQPGLKCGMCGQYHDWLPLTRDEAKQLANRDVPEKVQTYIDNLVDNTF